MFNRNNLFGGGPAAGRQSPGQNQAPHPQSRGDTHMGGYDAPRGNYGGQAPPPMGNRPMPQRPPVGRGPPAHGIAKRLVPAKVEDKTLQSRYIYGNM